MRSTDDIFEEMRRRRQQKDYIEPSALFTYWDVDGSQRHYVHADPCLPGEQAHPFHVLVKGEAHTPLSALVFARDEAHAKHRVLESIRVCINESSPPIPAHLDYRIPCVHEQAFLDKVQSGEWLLHVRPYNTNLIAATVIWASNGGYL